MVGRGQKLVPEVLGRNLALVVDEFEPSAERFQPAPLRFEQSDLVFRFLPWHSPTLLGCNSDVKWILHDMDAAA